MAAAKRVPTMLSVGAAAVLLASGCGGGGKKTAGSPTTTAAVPATTAATATPLGKADYEVKMRAIGTSVSESLGSINALTSKATAVRVLTTLQSSLRSAADRLAALSPPSRVKANHAQLVQAVRDFADELDSVIAKLKKGTLQATAVTTTILGLKGVAEVGAASTAIANKGFKIGSQ
jgi:hypothetical protein